jgi:hypothetical protein
MNYIPVIGFAICGGLSIYLGFMLSEKNRFIKSLKSYVEKSYVDAAAALPECRYSDVDCLGKVYKNKKVVAKKTKVKKAKKSNK